MVTVEELPAPVVEVTPESGPALTVEVPAPPGVVTVEVPGPAGPQGPKGDPGTVAPGTGDAHLAFAQSVPDTTWTVPHGLGKRPSVTVFDSAGTQVEGDVEHTDTNTLTIEFAYPFSGTVYLN